MTNKPAKRIAHLRKIDFKSWHATLWLVKRHLSAKEAVYSVLRVDIDKKLQSRLKKSITDKVQDSQYKLEEYSFSTADQDEHAFTMDTAENDFIKIQQEIEKGLQNKKAQEYEELLNSWAYVTKLEHDGDAVYGVKKINALTKAKKVYSVATLLFQDHLLVDLADKEVLTIPTDLDFFVYDGTTFITNKKAFENILNFRKGMENNRDSVLEEFRSLRLFSDVEPIRKIVGSNLHLLRMLSAIQKSGYYKDKFYMESLIKLNEMENWKLVIEK